MKYSIKSGGSWFRVGLCLAVFALNSAQAMTAGEFKSAFAEQRFADVVVGHEEAIKESPTAANWYRLGYAAMKVEKWHLADSALNAAKLADPSFKFVEKRSEFDQLRSRVDEHLQVDRPKAGRRDLQDSKSGPKNGDAAAAAADRVSVGAESVADADILPRRYIPADLGGSGIKKLSAEEARKRELQILSWIIISGAILAMLLSIFVTYFIYRRVFNAQQMREIMRLETCDFHEALDLFQQRTVNFASRLEAWGQSDSLLAWRLRALNDVIEQETQKVKTPDVQRVPEVLDSHGPFQAQTLEAMHPVLGHHNSDRIAKVAQQSALRSVIKFEGWSHNFGRGRGVNEDDKP